MNRNFFIFAVVLLCFPSFIAATERVERKNVPYYAETVLDGAGDYQKSQCVLDIFAPKDAKNLPVIIWFHGGGLTSGSKDVPEAFRQCDMVSVAVGYRLSPKAKFPEFLEDAAASIAWCFENIEKYGGDPKKIFVGGTSAGGYLTGMIGLDSRWLKPYGIEPRRIAGLIPFTGQMTTHFHVKELLKYPQSKYMPVIDENAPMYYVSKDCSPIAFVVGDRKIEWPGRVEENELMAASLRAMKHPLVEFHENPGFDHGTVGKCPEAWEQMIRFIEKVSGDKLR